MFSCATIGRGSLSIITPKGIISSGQFSAVYTPSFKTSFRTAFTKSAKIILIITLNRGFNYKFTAIHSHTRHVYSAFYFIFNKKTEKHSHNHSWLRKHIFHNNNSRGRQKAVIKSFHQQNRIEKNTKSEQTKIFIDLSVQWFPTVCKQSFYFHSRRCNRMCIITVFHTYMGNSQINCVTNLVNGEALKHRLYSRYYVSQKIMLEFCKFDFFDT